MEQLLQLVLQSDSEAICCAALRALGSVARKNIFNARMVLRPLFGMISDESQSINVRCAGASALGRISSSSKDALKWGKENTDRWMKDDRGKLLYSSFWRHAILANHDENADKNLIHDTFRGIESDLRSALSVPTERDHCLLALARIALAHPNLVKDLMDIIRNKDLTADLGVEAFIKLGAFVTTQTVNMDVPDGSAARLNWIRRFASLAGEYQSSASQSSGLPVSTEAAFLSSFEIFRPSYFTQKKCPAANDPTVNLAHLYCSSYGTKELNPPLLDEVLGCDLRAAEVLLKNKPSIAIHAAVQLSANPQLLLRKEFTSCFRKVMEDDAGHQPGNTVSQPQTDRLAETPLVGRLVLVSWLKKAPECCTLLLAPNCTRAVSDLHVHAALSIWNSIAAADDQQETPLLSATTGSESGDSDVSAVLLRRLAPRPTSIFSQITIPTYQNAPARTLLPPSAKAAPRQSDAVLESAAKRRKIAPVEESSSFELEREMSRNTEVEPLARLVAPVKPAPRQQKPESAPTHQPERRGNKAQERSKPVEHCRFWKITGCRDGDHCRFLHDGEPGRKDELCKFFKTNSCKKGDSCPYSHDTKRVACENILRDNACVYGEGCRYSHDQTILESARQKREDQKRKEEEIRAEQEAKERELRALPFLTSPFAASASTNNIPHVNYAISPLLPTSPHHLDSPVSSTASAQSAVPPMFAGISLPFDSMPPESSHLEGPVKETIPTLRVLQPPPVIAPLPWQAPPSTAAVPSSAHDELEQILSGV